MRAPRGGASGFVSRCAPRGRASAHREKMRVPWGRDPGQTANLRTPLGSMAWRRKSLGAKRFRRRQGPDCQPCQGSWDPGSFGRVAPGCQPGHPPVASGRPRKCRPPPVPWPGTRAGQRGHFPPPRGKGWKGAEMEAPTLPPTGACQGGVAEGGKRAETDGSGRKPAPPPCHNPCQTHQEKGGKARKMVPQAGPGGRSVGAESGRLAAGRLQSTSKPLSVTNN